MRFWPRSAVCIWLAGVVAAIAVISRTEFTADLSAFLPRSPSPAQQILVEQLRDGVVSRLILIGIEVGATERLAQASQRLAASLRAQDNFVSVNNGEESGFETDREYLWENRYLLSPAMTPEHFTARGLRHSLEEDLRLLATPAGMLLRRTLPSDPGGELMRLLEQLEGQTRPSIRHGVWFSGDGARALLLAQTRAAGYDIDAQERTLARIRGAFAEAAGGGEAKLLLTGPGVFSVTIRERIRNDAWKFSLVATVLIGAMLWALYRSPRAVGLGLLPVASGALAGIAAVSLGFGSVHGITLGFGVTLIGEGVDYAIYLFTQIAPGTAPRTTFDRIWPTLRLGVLTSLCGFSAMLFSGFNGLAQLGLFSMAGLVAAAAVTRWVLPELLPPGFAVPAVTAFAPGVMSLVGRAPLLRVPLLVMVALACVLLMAQREPIWSDDLSSLSPVSPDEQRLDQRLRTDIGAPDVRHLVIVRAKDEETALQGSERVAAALRRAVRQGWLEGFDSPAGFLPSQATQRARQAALPEPGALRKNLHEALRGLPFRARAFEPFLEEAAAARSMPPVDRGSLQGTSLALKLDSLLSKRQDGVVAMLPLRGVSNSGAISGEIGKVPGLEFTVLDLKRESDDLYRSYRREALTYSLMGAAAIIVLLFASLRAPRRVFEVLAPLAAAVVVTLGMLVLGGHRLSIFHLVGLLLVVAVGSNYSLFFERQALSDRDRERTIVSLLFANVSTVIGFGLLALSKVPVLNAIGSTVGAGAILTLVFSAILIGHRKGPAGRLP